MTTTAPDRKALLHQRGVRLKSLAEREGVSLSHLSRVVSGERRSIRLGRVIARELGLSLRAAFPEWFSSGERAAQVEHTRSIGAAPTGSNVKATSFPDSPLAARQLTLLSIPELLGDEINDWIERERASRSGATRVMLLAWLARRLELQNERQIYRYMSGETPFPLEKLAPLCVAIGSWRLLQLVNAIASRQRALPKLETFDLIVAQSTNLREFGEFVSAAAQSCNEPLSEDALRRLEREATESIRQIEQLLEIFRSMVARSAK